MIFPGCESERWPSRNCFFFFSCTGWLWFYLSNGIATLGYDVAQMKGDIVTLNDQNKRLEKEIAEAKSLERIELVATNDLKMVHSGRKDSLMMEASSAATGTAAVQSGARDAEPAPTTADRLAGWLDECLDSL